LLEGAMNVEVLGLAVPLARGGLAVESPDGRQIQVSVAGERRMGGSFADLFPGVTVPGASLIELQGALQVFANAGFDVASPGTGSYQAKIRGVLRVGGLQIDGDADVSVRNGGTPEVCVKLPASGRLCGRDIERALQQVTQQVVDAALETKRFFQNAGNDLEAAMNDAFREMGGLADAAAHMAHKKKQCKAEAADLGTRMGHRLRNRASAQARAFFDAIRPELGNAPPADRARAVAASWERLYRLVLEKRQRVVARGSERVDDWAFKAKTGDKLQGLFTQAFDAAAGDLRGVLAEVYARPENVGQPW
jgi:hypothetical protein